MGGNFIVSGTQRGTRSIVADGQLTTNRKILLLIQPMLLWQAESIAYDGQVGRWFYSSLTMTGRTASRRLLNFFLKKTQNKSAKLCQWKLFVILSSVVRRVNTAGSMVTVKTAHGEAPVRHEHDHWAHRDRQVHLAGAPASLEREAAWGRNHRLVLVIASWSWPLLAIRHKELVCYNLQGHIWLMSQSGRVSSLWPVHQSG